MTHDEARERLIDLAYGELDPAGRAAVEEHVTGCAGCSAELAAISRTREAAAGLPDAGLPGGRAELVEAARRAVATPVRPRRTLWARPAAWMATAAVVLAVGGVTLRWLDESPRPEPATPPAREARPEAPVAAAPAAPSPAAPARPGALASRERAAEAKAEAPAAAGLSRSAATLERPAFPPGVSGAFLSLDLRTGARFRVNPEACATRHSPLSTFEIPGSLIGLETGVVKGPDERWGWDPEVATRVGEPRVKKWLATFDYGNQDVSGGLDRFWLGNTLRISPDEQAEFLARLQRGQFPVAPRNLALVRELLTQESGAGYRLVAKTGSSADGEGWLVGWVEVPGAGCSFALHLRSSSYEEMARVRPGLARDFLRQSGCLPP